MSSMTPQRYEQIRSLFVEVCDLDPLSRSAILDERCATDSDLREEVESLLAEDQSYDRVAAALGSSIPHLLNRFEEQGEETVPPTIGNFTITRLIGQGGMGTVYEARQDHPSRIVAIKVTSHRLVSKSMLQRFIHEAHVLARLQHPGIAQIFEANVAETDHGTRPYFVMEHVRGEPLLEYSRTHNLSTRQRLELMARIADAIHHAHMKGVIHRDLKPSNILVTEAMDGGEKLANGQVIAQPKILDFGVARVTDPDLQFTTINTVAGQLIGTVAYMSPEQATGDPDQIDTRTDVYSLGVICFELLAGQHPLPLDRSTLHQALQLIRDSQPVKLGAINRPFRGEIETIVSKAMEKDRQQRYQSAADFSADLRRYLAGEPIIAKPASALYSLRKFSKRHKGLVATVSASIVILIAGVLGTSYGLRLAIVQRNLARDRLAQVEVARDEAETEAARSKAILDFTSSILSSVDPYRTQGEDFRVLDLLDEASERVQLELEQQPEILAALSETLGRAYMQLGHFPEAETHLRKALELRITIDGERSNRTASAMTDLAELLSKTAPRSTEIQPLLRNAVAVYRVNLGDDHVDTLAALNNLAICLAVQGNAAEAETLYKHVLSERTNLLGVNDPHTIESMNNLGSFYLRVGELHKAEELLRAAWRAGTEHLGQDERPSLIYARNLALVLKDKGTLDEAEQLIRHVVATRDRILGIDHPESLAALKTLIEILLAKGDIGQASLLGTQLIRNTQERFGDRDQATISTLAMVGVIYQQQGNLDEAERLFRMVLSARQETSGDSDSNTLAAMNNLGNVLLSKGNFDEATQLFRTAFENAQDSFPAGSWQPSQFQANYGACLSKAGNFEDAEFHLLKAHEALRTSVGEKHARTIKAAKALVDMYTRWGKPERAEIYRGMIPDAETTH